MTDKSNTQAATLHDDELRDIARELQDEILTCGLDQQVLMRGMRKALKAQADIATQDFDEDSACRAEPSDWVPPSDHDGDGSVAGMAARAACALVALQGRDDLTFEQIEACLPENIRLNQDESMSVSAQQMHDFARNLLAAHASLPAGGVVEPVAWESTTAAYTKFITQARFEKLRPEAQRWYKPYRCSACAQPSETPSQLRPSDDKLWDQTLSERDAYCKWADRLADAIAAHTGVDIGEHSNINNPWQEALDALSAQPSETQGRRQMTDAEERQLATGKAIERAASQLPDFYNLEVCVERGAAWVTLTCPEAENIAPTFDGDHTLAEQVDGCIEAAIRHATPQAGQGGEGA